jgi:hypothetical protein
MEFLELVNNPDLHKILQDFQVTKQLKKRVGFNLLTLSSYTSHLENFHSDVIAALLNPKGLHGEGHLFLDLLIDFLNQNHDTQIDKANFKNAIVEREKGRIDIWITDKVSKKAIIVENKINNAPDQKNQIERYHDFSANKKGYDVCCIIYLYLGGYKEAPKTENEAIKSLLKNIAAYNDKPIDLYNGWLLKSLTQNIHTDTYTFVYQYSKLIQHLSNNNMNMEAKEAFYDFLSTNNAFETIQTIITLRNGLAEYRAQRFFDSVNGQYAPFTKIYPANDKTDTGKTYHCCFENFKRDDNAFKIDVVFHQNRDAVLQLWNPGKDSKDQENSTVKLLEEIGMPSEFSKGGFGGGMKKAFEISDFSGNIVELDKELLNFFKKLLEAFSKLQSKV